MSKHLLLFNAIQENEKPVAVNLVDTKRVAHIYRAINNTVRQHILQFIEANVQVNVTDVCTSLGLKQPEASLHLAILRKAGFVKANRKGKYMFYIIHQKRMQELNQSMRILVKQGSKHI